MMQWQDLDTWGAASHRLMIAHLTGPFSAGAAEHEVAVSAEGRLEITWSSREPLVLVAPRILVSDAGWQLTAVADPDGAATPLPVLDYVRASEPGSFLPLYRPTVDAQTRRANPFTLALALAKVADDGTQAAAPAAQIAVLLEIHLIEGVLGRLIYLLGAEKQRLRRQGRELAAQRLLASAHDSALDSTGADLGVERFADTIQYDVAHQEIVTAGRRDANGNPILEPDSEYRRRLALYRPLLMPNRRNVLALLNGPGGDADPNQGPLGALGVAQRFQVSEGDNQLAVAIHLVGAANPHFLDNFIRYLRAVYLILPLADADSNASHAQRYLAAARRAEVEALRARLRQAFAFNPNAALAPMLADALDRVGRCRAALGVATQWMVTRTQDGSAGSRYELGLGLDLQSPLAAELQQLHDKLLDPARPAAPDTDIEQLLRLMSPQPPANDPDGSWLLRPCGMQTVHRLDAGHLYLSHLPTSGMVISGPTFANPGDQVPLEARYQAPEDPGGNVVLVAGVAAAHTEWVVGHGEDWTQLADAVAPGHWDQAGPRPAGDPALAIFAAAGLPAVATPGPVVVQLKQVPPELLVTLQLGPVLAGQIIAGTPAATGTLRMVVALLSKHGLSAALPLITGPAEVLLVVAVIGLPGAGVNLSDRRATGFRWYVVPIQGPGGSVRAIGSRTTFVPSGGGLSALVALGYARQSGSATDAYAYHVDLPNAALMSLPQYEFLMNLLNRAYPLGVEVNTYAIRQQHVDLDGNGAAEPLPPTISRTFRQFQRRRQHGETNNGITTS